MIRSVLFRVIPWPWLNVRRLSICAHESYIQQTSLNIYNREKKILSPIGNV